MANTYSQIYLQFVFAVKGRQNLIKESFREELQKYICGIAKNKGQQVVSIYANPDHIHILVSFKNLSISISDFVKLIKVSSTIFINEMNWCVGKFYWQEGYGCFSYSKSQVESVKKYIDNQKKHHEKISFRKEYITFLEKFKVEYDEKYLFNFED